MGCGLGLLLFAILSELVLDQSSVLRPGTYTGPRKSKPVYRVTTNNGETIYYGLIDGKGKFKELTAVQMLDSTVEDPKAQEIFDDAIQRAIRRTEHWINHLSPLVEKINALKAAYEKADGETFTYDGDEWRLVIVCKDKDEYFKPVDDEKRTQWVHSLTNLKPMMRKLELNKKQLSEIKSKMNQQKNKILFDF